MEEERGIFYLGFYYLAWSLISRALRVKSHDGEEYEGCVVVGLGSILWVFSSFLLYIYLFFVWDRVRIGCIGG